MDIAFYIAAHLIFGLIVGSFLSVCIYRLPLGRELTDPTTGELMPTGRPEDVAITIANPRRSFCPHCRRPLLWYHNIPLFSWLALRGSCAYCKAPISARYPLVEALTALTALLCYQRFGISTTEILVFLFCAALIVISFIDYDYFIIPNVISIPGIFIGLAIGVINQFLHIFEPPVVSGVGESLLGFTIGGGFLWVVAAGYMKLRHKEGLGLGDVKLLAFTGALFGVQATIYTIFVGSLFGSILGLLIILCKGRSFSHHIPFGPYLAVATVLYLFTGDQLLDLIGLGMNQMLSQRVG